MLKRFLILWSLPIWLIGCSLHQPQLVELSVPLPQQYTELTDQGETEPPLERWWQSFNDPRLNALMSELFDQNLQLQQGFARLQQARAGLNNSRAGQRPSLDIEGQYSRNQVPGFVSTAITNNYRLAAAAGFELDLWGKLRSRSKAAAMELQAERGELQTLYLSLSAQLVDLYYLAAEQRQQLVLLDRISTARQETLKMIENRYRSGLYTVEEVYQAQRNLAEAEAERPLTETNLIATEHAIAVLLGRYPQRNPDSEANSLPQPPAPFPTGLPSQLIARRPDLQAALRRIAAADARVAAAIADRFPAIRLQADYGILQNDFGIGAITGTFWTLLSGLSQPVIDGGRRRAEVDRNRALLREIVARYQQVALEAFKEVETALSANRTGAERVNHRQAATVASAAAYRLAKHRYRSGLSDYLPILSSEIADLSARRQLLAARRQLISERISLARALGGNWMATELDKQQTLSDKRNKS